MLVLGRITNNIQIVFAQTMFILLQQTIWSFKLTQGGRTFFSSLDFLRFTLKFFRCPVPYSWRIFYVLTWVYTFSALYFFFEVHVIIWSCWLYLFTYALFYWSCLHSILCIKEQFYFILNIRSISSKNIFCQCIFLSCSISGLTNLESLNLDSCKIKDEGLANLAGYLLEPQCFFSSLFFLFYYYYVFFQFWLVTWLEP